MSTVKVARFLFGLMVAVAAPVLAAAGCSGDDEESPPGGSSGDAGARLDAPFRPDASCPVVIESPELIKGEHVPEGTELSWSSNPPSSGPHYPVWATFQEYAAPVPRAYLVHSMEHGAVLLLYKCDQPCPAIVDELRKVRDAIAPDPLCSDPIRARVIIAPDPLLDVPVAAAAWGWTYKAECVDAPTLTQFARDHYAQGPENTCSPGRAF